MSDTESDESLDLENESKVVIEDEEEDDEEEVKYKIKAKKKSKPIPIPKKKGRPAKPLEEKLAKQVITKEKVIYMVQNENGEYEKMKKPKFTARELKKMELEKEKEKKELELGKKLIQRKNGKIDKRSIGGKTRTLAQIEATRRLVEANKKRRAEKQDHKNKEVKNMIKDSVKEVVSEPAVFYEPKQPQIPEWSKYGF
tara:strand:+ start:3802 stop:4395 length:594 start_codon:yes stop_codon:yes gene_type:complete